ncbi:hypothetical protein TGGT1_259060 [Toxoplasma gondii GT1]|uniref:Uncharacterized protein n=1 Tax=Toxoplasma gondii (strain ATCC 50853 / GT1) TaxID=507601 RepID=S7UYH4_TOXGG|nr:hypothetical protein TGGT1_259060 [Toxoplasma gondii GT1]
MYQLSCSLQTRSFSVRHRHVDSWASGFLEWQFLPFGSFLPPHAKATRRTTDGDFCQFFVVPPQEQEIERLPEFKCVKKQRHKASIAFYRFDPRPQPVSPPPAYVTYTNACVHTYAYACRVSDVRIHTYKYICYMHMDVFLRLDLLGGSLPSCVVCIDLSAEDGRPPRERQTQRCTCEKKRDVQQIQLLW